MQIDLQTISIKPLRHTFSYLARRYGDKPVSRYLEATMDVQANANFHYRPTWDPDHEIFDPTRTRIAMKDWYVLTDPRQFYYGTYTAARARMQETAEADFEFVEDRGLADDYPAEAKKLALDVMLPLRHVAWGANMNNSSMCAYGYGTSFTQPCIYQAMDQLGIAQYITRLGLLLADADALDAAKQAWLTGPMWQELRRYVEDTFVMTDWFEMHVAQNYVLDGLLYPLVYRYIEQELRSRGGPTLSMLTRFQNEWYPETAKWVDATVKTAAAESPENKQQISSWTKAWRDRAMKALAPLAERALGSQAQSVVSEMLEQFNARAAKAGLAL